MDEIGQLAERLEVAAQLLNAAAEDIRDLPLDPVGQRLREVGEALANIHEIQHAIFTLRPELQPEFLREKSPDADANRRLTAVLSKAYRLMEVKCIDEAGAVLMEYVSMEASEMHKRIALHEAERVRGLPR
jgi:hypothetical protein